MDAAPVRGCAVVGDMQKLATNLIEVVFIDSNTGKTFAQTKMPAGSLPQSFAADLETILDIGDQGSGVGDGRSEGGRGN